MTRMSVADARVNMADALNRVAYAGERVVLERRGKGVAVLVSMEDLELLEELEDRADVRAVKRAKADAKRKGEKPVAWGKAKADAGL